MHPSDHLLRLLFQSAFPYADCVRSPAATADRRRAPARRRVLVPTPHQLLGEVPYSVALVGGRRTSRR